MRLLVKRLESHSKLPTKGHDDDHCFDFYAAEQVRLQPGQTAVVSLGVAIGLPYMWAMILKERSGLAAKGISIKGGVIDTGYRGELKAIVQWMPPQGGNVLCDSPIGRNLGWDPGQHFVIQPGDKICQGKLERTTPEVAVVEVDDLEVTLRGDAGFGSTGS